MFGNIQEVLIFLISTVFDLFLYVLIFRFILAYVGINSAEPIAQFISKATSFITTPVRKFIPDYKGFEIGTLVIIFFISMLKNFLRVVIAFGIPNVTGLLMGLPLMAFGDTLYLFSQVIFYTILIQAILSIIQPASPISGILWKITQPVLKPFQKLIPPIGGIDISPIIPLILIQVVTILIITPMISKGYVIALSS